MFAPRLPAAALCDPTVEVAWVTWGKNLLCVVCEHCLTHRYEKGGQMLYWVRQQSSPAVKSDIGVKRELQVISASAARRLRCHSKHLFSLLLLCTFDAGLWSSHAMHPGKCGHIWARAKDNSDFLVRIAHTEKFITSIGYINHQHWFQTHIKSGKCSV